MTVLIVHYCCVRVTNHNNMNLYFTKNLKVEVTLIVCNMQLENLGKKSPSVFADKLITVNTVIRRYLYFLY